jgi:hypothetical protein
LSSPVADRVAGVVVACAGLAMGVVMIVNGESIAWGLLMAGLFLFVARAALARKVVADFVGLSFNDGVRTHRLPWDCVERVVVSERRAYVLHDRRYIDPLPLPGTQFGRSTEIASIVDQLEEIRKSRSSRVVDPCLVRIVGGLRWRTRTTVVRMEANTSLTQLYGQPPDATSQLITLLRLATYRRQAESVRQAEARRIGCDPA